MNTKILKKINIAVCSLYLLNIFAIFFFLSANVFHNFIKAFISIILIIDLYFITIFYSSKQEKKDNTTVNRKSIKYLLSKAIFIIKNIIILAPFFITLLTILLVFNIISIDNIISRNATVISLLTYLFPNLFFVYILRIGQFFYYFSKIYKSKFISDIVSKIAISLFVLISILFMITYFAFNNKILDRLLLNYKNVLEEISFEASSSLSQYLQDDFTDTQRIEAFEDFASAYDIEEIVLRVGGVLYKSENYDDFKKSHFVFETLILKSAEFTLILSGKKFSTPIYISILIFIAASLLLILPLIFIIRFLLLSKIGRYITIMCNGFLNEEFNLSIDINSMEENEILSLAKCYNNIFLPLKYRNKYMNDNKNI